jgi:hypothetical protein
MQGVDFMYYLELGVGVHVTANLKNNSLGNSIVNTSKLYIGIGDVILIVYYA